MENQPQASQLASGPRRRGKQYENRRREVLNAAIELFSSKGYMGTTLLEIADAVGLLKGSLYYYAKSKEDLLLAVIEEVFTEGLEATRELSSGPGSPAERLERWLERSALYMLSHRRESAIYFFDAKSLSAEHTRTLRRRGSLYVGEVVKLLEEGRASGDFRSDLDVGAAAIALMGAINWLAIQDPADAPSPSQRAAYATRYSRHLLDSVRPAVH
jgi:AcrR family transcriptional regulator